MIFIVTIQKHTLITMSKAGLAIFSTWNQMSFCGLCTPTAVPLKDRYILNTLIGSEETEMWAHATYDDCVQLRKEYDNDTLLEIINDFLNEYDDFISELPKYYKAFEEEELNKAKLEALKGNEYMLDTHKYFFNDNVYGYYVQYLDQLRKDLITIKKEIEDTPSIISHL